MARHFITDHSTRCVDLSNNVARSAAGKNCLHWPLFSKEACDFAWACQAHEKIDIVIKRNCSSRSAQHICNRCFLSLSNWLRAHVLVGFFVVEDVLSLCDRFCKQDCCFNGVSANACFMWQNEHISTLKYSWWNVLGFLSGCGLIIRNHWLQNLWLKEHWHWCLVSSLDHPLLR